MLSNIKDKLTDANINDEYLLKVDRNIVNVCINNNDNFLDAELAETQEQVEPSPPTIPIDFLDLAVGNVDSDNVSILLGNGTGSFSIATNYDTGYAPIICCNWWLKN